MQSDIVQRLRQPWFTHGCAEYQHEAADEIERNRAEITRLTEALRAAEEREKALREAVNRIEGEASRWKHPLAARVLIFIALAGAKP